MNFCSYRKIVVLKPLLYNFNRLSSTNPLVYRTIFTGKFYPSGHYADGHYGLKMNAIASRNQFKPIRIGENLAVNYRVIETRFLSDQSAYFLRAVFQ